jgi:hypothetical protein
MMIIALRCLASRHLCRDVLVDLVLLLLIEEDIKPRLL